MLFSTFLLSNSNPNPSLQHKHDKTPAFIHIHATHPILTQLCYTSFVFIRYDFVLHLSQHNSSTVMCQVADGRGNCTPHRNPTPCTIPQDRESIFHSIFAFFTKSGRKVLVNMQPSHCILTFQRSLTPREDSCFFFVLGFF